MQNQTSQTTFHAPSQEVALRTLSSDISSLEKGNQAPLPEELIMPLSARYQEEDTPKNSTPAASHWGIILTVIILLVVAVILYFVVYPILSGPSSTILY